MLTGFDMIAGNDYGWRHRGHLSGARHGTTAA
jgi:hypothetical protein